MLKIRLKRVGRKHDPSFRIVVTEKHRGVKSGKYIENVGFYDARRDVREVDGERVKYWISKGAQVSDTVHNILITEKVIDGKKVNVLPKKKPIVKEVEDTSQSVGDVEGAPKSTEDEESSKEEPGAEASSQGSGGADAPTGESAKEATEAKPEESKEEPAPSEEAPTKENPKEESPA